MRCFRRRLSYLNSGSRRKLSTKQKIGIVVAILLIVVIGILLYLTYVVNPIIIEMSEAKVRSLATQAIGSAVYDVVNQENIYDDFISITKDNDGNVLLIEANSIQINLFNRTLTRTATQKLEGIGEEGIDIPIGTFSGLPILSGVGPTINIKMIPIGAISSSFKSEFKTTGINQTIHSIYVVLTSKINLILPTAHTTIEASTKVLVCESIIVGKIPDTYLQSDSLDEMMNLIPNY